MQQWMDARIIDYGVDWVRLECLIDPEDRVFQMWMYERGFIADVVPIEKGRYVRIGIEKRPAERIFTVEDGEGVVDAEAFEDPSRFDDLEDLDLDSPLGLHKDI